MAASRSDFLKNCVARLYAAQLDYVQSRNDEIGPKHAFWLAAEALIRAFDDPHGDIPADCRRIFTAVMGNGESTGFKAAWNHWSRREVVSDKATWRPSAAVWRAFRDIGNAMKAEARMPQRTVDTVADLVKQGVDDSQIAYIYERFTRTGARDLAWVAHMKEHPELNTLSTRCITKRKQEMSRQEWEAFAAKLAATPRIQQVREMLERGEDPETAISKGGSRFAAEFELREFEPQPFEELPAEWDEPAASSRENSGDYDRYETPELEAMRVARKETSITLEQRAVMLLDDGVPDEEIKQQCGIEGPKLGAIKRNADRIRETMPQLEPVEV